MQYMDFVAIDFETANSYRNSACSIGITRFENFQLVEMKTWLIKPPSWPAFTPFNISIHGITPDMVRNAPTFAQLWPEIAHYFDNSIVIAHNASFDIAVLKAALQVYHIELPRFSYFCSCIMAKKAWPGKASYSLDNMCRFHKIPLKHHDAGEDAHAAAQLVSLAIQHKQLKNWDDFQCTYNVNLKSFPVAERKTQRSSRIKPPALSSLLPTFPVASPSSFFHNKTVVFTGTLAGMTRRQAAQALVDRGGMVSEFLNEHVDYLIVGSRPALYAKAGEASKKQQIARELIAQGAKLQVIPESIFLREVSG